MEAGKALGTQPVISAKEMIDPEVDHLGIMAYVALFQHIKPQAKSQPPSRASPVSQPAPVRVQPAPSTPVMSSPRVPPGEMLQLITATRQSHVNSPVRGHYFGCEWRFVILAGFILRMPVDATIAQMPSIGLYRENAIAIESEAKYPFGGNVYYVTMQITLHIPESARRERNLHCDVVHSTTKWVFRLTLDHAIAAIQTSR